MSARPPGTGPSLTHGNHGAETAFGPSRIDPGMTGWEPNERSCPLEDGCVNERLLDLRNDAWMITTSVGVTFEVDQQRERVVALPAGEIISI